MYINPHTFRQWWDIFHTQEDMRLVEIRLLGKTKGKKQASGYFTDCDKALEAIERYPETLGVYSCINAIKTDCYGRAQHDIIIDNPECTTSDNNILGRTWILIDLDAKRSPGTNATDAELAGTKEIMRNVGIYLRDQGLSSPVVAMSGNGYHMYYKVSIVNDSRSHDLVQNFINALDMLFANDVCDIDCTVFNASRTAKVIGTKSNKGADTEERPQRESYFIKVPDVIETTDRAYIEKIASQLPKEEKPSRFNSYSTDKFDIESFLSQHGIKVARRTRYNNGTKLVLEECPFDSNHKAPDSAIFVMDSGAIGFKCLHNSCSTYTWRDVRMKFDPMAYTQFDRETRQSFHSYHQQAVIQQPVEPQVPPDAKPWFSMSEIKWVDPSQEVYIPTGYIDLDKKTRGLGLGEVTILTGLAGSGKSTFLNNIILNAVNRGYKCAVWSGELSASRFQGWIDQAAAGKGMVRQKAGYENWYYCPRDVADKINRWLDGKLWLRNNDYGSSWSQMRDNIIQVIDECKVNMVVIDNLSALVIDFADQQENARQTQFINAVNAIAKQKHVHIILVCHPRKENLNTLIRMESIAGSKDIYGLTDNAILVHRTGPDFTRKANDLFGKKMVEGLQIYDTIIEVQKNRIQGSKTLVGLYYEPKARRFLNTFDEHVIYGWQDDETPAANYHYNQEAREIPDDPLDIRTQPSEIPF